MPFVTTKEMLRRAQEGSYAVGAFNVENMEMVKTVIAAAEEMRAPLILQTTPSTISYGGLATFASMVLAEAKRADVPVALHLDHGNSFNLAVQAIKEGYSSIMIDGSGEEFEKNIELTKRVVEVAEPNQLPVEAELGKVGGKEDSLEVKGDSNTNPKQAAEFVRRTNITSLAVAIGTAHGFYIGTPILDKERLSEIGREVSIPLVLHGASGLENEEVRACIKRGICKVNFATELRAAYTDAIKLLLREKPETFDPKSLGKVGMASVKQLVMNRIEVCGCCGKIL